MVISEFYMKVFLYLMLMFSSFYLNASYAQERVKETYVGSKIPETKLSSPVTMDKSYSELSDKERATVRKAYKGLAENDVPPYPVKGTRKILAPILKAFARINKEGNIAAIAVVDKYGDAKKVSIFETVHPSISKVMAAALMDTKYTPGTCNGEPCASEFLFTFSLEFRD